MEIKKFVAIVLVVSIVSLVPLQALAQVEPRITYGEWCAQLDELYQERAVAPRTTDIFNPMVCGMLLGLTLEVALGLLTIVTPHSFQGLNIELALYTVALLPMIIGTVQTLLRVTNPPKTETRYWGIIQEEIDLLKTAGANRMWFYPCE